MADDPEDYQPLGENSLKDDRSQRRNTSSYYPLQPPDRRPTRNSGPSEPPAAANGNFCAHCGAELPVSVRFCGSCGAPRVQRGSQQAPPERAQQPLQGYGPPPGESQQLPRGGGQQSPPGWGQQPLQGYGPPPGHGSSVPLNTILGTAGLVCGIVGLFLFGLILGVLAVILGLVALLQGSQTNRGPAIAAVVLGLVDAIAVQVFLK